MENINNNGLQSIVKNSYYLFVGGVHTCAQKTESRRRFESPPLPLLTYFSEAGSLPELRVHVSAKLEVSKHQ